MSAVHLLKRLGACREAIDWADDRATMGDADLWLACDNPHWLLWLLDRSRLHGRQTLDDALAPIWRAQKVAIHAEWDAYAAAEEANPDWSGLVRDANEARYIAACVAADSNAASMIRHTVALPTRQQLIAAADYWAEHVGSVPF